MDASDRKLSNDLPHAEAVAEMWDWISTSFRNIPEDDQLVVQAFTGGNEPTRGMMDAQQEAKMLHVYSRKIGDYRALNGPMFPAADLVDVLSAAQ